MRLNRMRLLILAIAILLMLFVPQDDESREDVQFFMNEHGLQYNTHMLLEPSSNLNDWTARNRAL